MKRVIGVIILSFLIACSEQEKVVEVEKEIEQSKATLLVFDYLKQQTGEKKLFIGPDDLQLIMEKTDHLGMTHVKFQQIYKSVPVWNKELFAHINTQNEVFRVDQNVALIPEDFSVQPKLSVEEMDKYAVKTINKTGAWQVKQSSLIIYVNAEKIATLAYLIELNKGLLTEFVILNAQNGELLHQVTGTYTQG